MKRSNFSSPTDTPEIRKSFFKQTQKLLSLNHISPNISFKGNKPFKSKNDLHFLIAKRIFCSKRYLKKKKPLKYHYIMFWIRTVVTVLQRTTVHQSLAARKLFSEATNQSSLRVKLRQSFAYEEQMGKNGSVVMLLGFWICRVFLLPFIIDIEI